MLCTHFLPYILSPLHKDLRKRRQRKGDNKGSFHPLVSARQPLSESYLTGLSPRGEWITGCWSWLVLGRWMPRMLGMPGLPSSSGQVCRAMPKVSEQCRPRCQSGIPANTPPPDSPPPVAVVTEPNGIKCKWRLKFFKLSGQHTTCFHSGTFVIKKIKIHTKKMIQDALISLWYQ